MKMQDYVAAILALTLFVASMVTLALIIMSF